MQTAFWKKWMIHKYISIIDENTLHEMTKYQLGQRLLGLGTLSCIQVSATGLKILHLYIKSVPAQL